MYICYIIIYIFFHVCVCDCFDTFILDGWVWTLTGILGGSGQIYGGADAGFLGLITSSVQGD